MTLGFTTYAVLVIPMMLLMAQGDIWLAALAGLVAALPMPIVQRAGYPTYAKRFHTRVRYTGMAITGVLDECQQAYMVIVPQVQAYAPSVLLSA